MKVLIIGAGSREHALAWKIKQSPLLTALYIAPGNAGTGGEGENVPLDIKDNKQVVDFAKENNIDLVVVGPDDYLAQGMVDALMRAGIKAFGPTKAAARLEWSKAYAKDFMRRHGIPTASSETFTSLESALRHIEKIKRMPTVIKADGLALGKGVVIAQTKEEAEKTLRSFMADGILGKSGQTVVIEEFLEGSEVSIHAFCDGNTAKLFPVSRDHKRVGDDNTGPNTGGMGTIAPVSVPSGFLEEVEHKIVVPVIEGMKKTGNPFMGVLYPGLMVTGKEIRVVEFNARFGQPECESYVRLLKTDLLEIMLACTEGTLQEIKIEWSPQYVCTVMVVSEGYPGEYKKGFPITGLNSITDPSIVVFHVATKKEGSKLVTAGGRVLGVSAVGASPKEAKNRAYKAAESIHFEGAIYRHDIGAFWGI